jgi:hypothetical protein
MSFSQRWTLEEIYQAKADSVNIISSLPEAQTQLMKIGYLQTEQVG